MSFIFAYKYAIRRIPANQKGSKLNGTHQLMLCAGKDNVGRFHPFTGHEGP